MKNYFDDYIKDLERNLNKVVKDHCDKIRDSAIRLAPKDSGALAQSIESHTKGLRGTVGSDLPYAISVEYGTKDTTAKPYLRAAFDKDEASFFADIQRTINKKS